jgi:hypothetical protein
VNPSIGPIVIGPQVGAPSVLTFMIGTTVVSPGRWLWREACRITAPPHLRLTVIIIQQVLGEEARYKESGSADDQH